MRRIRSSRVLAAAIGLLITLPASTHASERSASAGPSLASVRNALTCPPVPRHTPASPISDERFAREYAATDDVTMERLSGTPTTTKSRERIFFPAIRSTWFAGHAGGAANGERVAYDPTSQILYSCRHFDTASEIAVERVAKAPPAYVQRVSSVAFATSHGIGIGSTPRDIDAEYGPAKPLAIGGRTTLLRYRYLIRLTPGTLFVCETSFLLNRGHVIGIERLSGV